MYIYIYIYFYIMASHGLPGHMFQKGKGKTKEAKERQKRQRKTEQTPNYKADTQLQNKDQNDAI